MNVLRVYIVGHFLLSGRSTAAMFGQACVSRGDVRYFLPFSGCYYRRGVCPICTLTEVYRSERTLLRCPGQRFEPEPEHVPGPRQRALVA